jgi:hypothetical protein
MAYDESVIRYLLKNTLILPPLIVPMRGLT